MIATRMSSWLAPACVAALSLAAPAARAESALATGAGVALRAQMDLRIVVPARARLVTLVQPHGVDIRPEHLRQGFIDVEATTLLQITHNTRNGLRLSLASQADWIDRVEARLLGQQLTLQRDSSGALLMAPSAETEPVAVSYRLHLNERATLGRQPWPVTLGLSPDRL